MFEEFTKKANVSGKSDTTTALNQAVITKQPLKSSPPKKGANTIT